MAEEESQEFNRSESVLGESLFVAFEESLFTRIRNPCFAFHLSPPGRTSDPPPWFCGGLCHVCYLKWVLLGLIRERNTAGTDPEGAAFTLPSSWVARSFCGKFRGFKASFTLYTRLTLPSLPSSK